MRRIVLIFIAAVLLVCCCGCGETVNIKEEAEYTGAPVYISEFCPAEDTFWFIRQEYTGENVQGFLYRLNENGKEEYVRRLPWAGASCAWNREKERFYYISENVLYEYEPETAESEEYKLNGDYSYASCASGDNVYLLNGDTLKCTQFSLKTFEETAVSIGTSPVIYSDNSCYVVKDSAECAAGCYDATTYELLWRSSPFAVKTSIDACISGDKVYMCSDNSSGVYVRALNGSDEAVMTAIGTRTHAVADGGEYVVCAVRAYKSIEFKALYPDGKVKDIAVWDNVNFYLVGSVLLEVWNGKLYCTLTTEDWLFSYDLI